MVKSQQEIDRYLRYCFMCIDLVKSHLFVDTLIFSIKIGLRHLMIVLIEHSCNYIVEEEFIDHIESITHMLCGRLITYRKMW